MGTVGELKIGAYNRRTRRDSLIYITLQRHSIVRIYQSLIQFCLLAIAFLFCFGILPVIFSTSRRTSSVLTEARGKDGSQANVLLAEINFLYTNMWSISRKNDSAHGNEVNIETKAAFLNTEMVIDNNQMIKRKRLSCKREIILWIYDIISSNKSMIAFVYFKGENIALPWFLVKSNSNHRITFSHWLWVLTLPRWEFRYPMFRHHRLDTFFAQIRDNLALSNSHLNAYIIY